MAFIGVVTSGTDDASLDLGVKDVSKALEKRSFKLRQLSDTTENDAAMQLATHIYQVVGSSGDRSSVTRLHSMVQKGKHIPDKDVKILFSNNVRCLTKAWAGVMSHITVGDRIDTSALQRLVPAVEVGVLQKFVDFVKSYHSQAVAQQHIYRRRFKIVIYSS